jgi:hypothetical protein
MAHLTDRQVLPLPDSLPKVAAGTTNRLQAGQTSLLKLEDKETGSIKLAKCSLGSELWLLRHKNIMIIYKGQTIYLLDA